MQEPWESRVCDRVIPSVSTQPSLRILVVDNNRDCAVSLCLLCRLWGHEAQYCYDAHTALTLAEALQPNVYLLDIAMPVCNGYELVRELQRRTDASESLFVAVSGYADERHRALAAECGFDRYFAKPVELRQLQELLAAHAAWPRNRRLSPIRELVPA